jgi:Tol biopolymer transport system component
MALQPGHRLGPYEIVELRGKGGMGEVYRARDTRLERDVALKVLPTELSEDEVFRRRFEREAKTISQLQHPNVCTLHDVGSQDGVDYLVMEFLEGETLQDRIARGPLAIDEALRIGSEVAEGIEAAHRGGVVHRDLKPGNVVLTTGGAKVLDFGLARDTGSVAVIDTEAATMPATITEEGHLVGTMPYMAPEQLQGSQVDARSDIWALGCLLYEMATGTRPFGGPSRADLIASILGTEPEPPTRRQPLAPRHFDHVVKRCLEKDPERRWQSARDVGLELLSPAEVPENPEPSPGRRIAAPAAAALGVLILLAGLALGFVLFRNGASGSAEADATWTTTSLDLEAPVERLALSPDGRSLLFRRLEGEGHIYSTMGHLYRRDLASQTETPIAGSERSVGSTVFSPDGQHLFFEELDDRLSTLPVRGGAATPRVRVAGASAAWGSDGFLYYTPSLTGMWSSIERTQLWRIPESGGSAEQVGHGVYPDLVPNKRIAFSAHPTRRPGEFWAHVYALDLETGEEQELVAGTQPHYLHPGFLVFYRAGGLWAAPIDPTTGELLGAARQIETGLARWNAMLDYGEFTLAESGDLAFVVGRGGGGTGMGGGLGRPGRLVRVSRDGRDSQELAPEPRVFGSPFVSVDGRQLSTSARTATGTEQWILDLETRSWSKPTQPGQRNRSARWLPPNGGELVFSSDRSEGRSQLHVQPADRGAAAEPLLPSEHTQGLIDISPDGRQFVYFNYNFPGLQVLDRDTGETTTLVGESATGFHTYGSSFHPSGSWIVYSRLSGGSSNLWLCPFPGPCQPEQLTDDGGQEPHFSADGSELFYRNATHMMAASVSVEAGRLVMSRAEPLFEDVYLHHYDSGFLAYALDGEGRFLMIQPTEEADEDQQVILIQNWRAKVVQTFAETGP